MGERLSEEALTSFLFDADKLLKSYTEEIKSLLLAKEDESKEAKLLMGELRLFKDYLGKVKEQEEASRSPLVPKNMSSDTMPPQETLSILDELKAFREEFLAVSPQEDNKTLLMLSTIEASLKTLTKKVEAIEMASKRSCECEGNSGGENIWKRILIFCGRVHKK